MALTADRNTTERPGKQYSYPVAAATKIYAGSIVALDASGNAVAASLTTGLVVVGMAEEQADNSAGAAADINVKVKAGCFGFAKHGTMTKTSIGDVVYCYDDATVQTSSSGASVAGILTDVDSAGTCFVQMGPPIGLATTGLLSASNLSDIGTAATAAHNLGLGTADSPTFAGLTLTGAQVGTTAAYSGIVTYLQNLRTVTSTGTVAFATDGGGTIQDLTDNGVVTLPDITAGSKGFRVTVQNTAADGAAKISVSPHSSDKIKGQIGSVEFSGTADKDAINTKATQKQGDHITLQSDGVDSWWTVGGIGVWASES